MTYEDDFNQPHEILARTASLSNIIIEAKTISNTGK
jgi:hypothetical protein